jgi:hypothetical protein
MMDSQLGMEWIRLKNLPVPLSLHLHYKITNSMDFYPWVLHPVVHLSNLVSYEAINRNKVPICQISLFIFLPTHYMFRPLQAIFR